ncbi:DUF2057 domain-containing protein, partial [Salinivibrio sp. VYel6]|uniref:DUF2057 family protein n=1 Tax=Salinivibrio sp. VYel6 TaxID=2490493 RepID=UPI00128DF0CD
MKKVVGMGLVLSTLLAASVTSAAEITSAPNIEFVVVDGKEISFEDWAPQQTIELANGTHQLVMRFDGEVKRGSKEVIFTSRPYLFELDVDGRDATINIDTNLRVKTQATSYFDDNPQWQAEFDNGEVMPLEAVELKGDGFGAYADMEALVAEYNRENGIIIDQGESKNLNDVLVEVDDQ